jgi:hypothetical protein
MKHTDPVSIVFSLYSLSEKKCIKRYFNKNLSMGIMSEISGTQFK